jgi:predicted metal-binding membrane protein
LSGPASNHAQRVPDQGVTALLGQARLSLLVSLVLLTVGAWGLTLYQTLTMGPPTGMAGDDALPLDHMDGMAMAGMHASGLSLMGAAVFLVVWTVMMAAMMLPAAAPMILTFAQAQARRNRAVVVPTWVFVAGYLLVWLVAGLVVYPLIQIGQDMTAHPATMSPAEWAPLALGSVVIVAGLYQFTPLKRLCLRHCRSPLAFVALHWREGKVGALRMGVRHGLYCLGCCWALFGILVAAGVMNLAWMLLLTLLIFAEKALPLGQRFSSGLGLALITVGLAVAGGVVPLSWIAT